MIPAYLLLLLIDDSGLYSGIEVGEEADPLHIEQIIGGWFIPGATIGERFMAGVAKNPNSLLAAESFAAGAIIAEGRFQ
jgi:hypothetical protein